MATRILINRIHMVVATHILIQIILHTMLMLVSLYTPIRFMSGFIFSKDQSAMSLATNSLGMKTEYTPRTVVRLVNIFSCLVYD